MPEDFNTLLDRAAQARREHRHDLAERLAGEAVRVSERRGSRMDLARAMTALGQTVRDQGRFEQAVQLYEQAADIYRADGPPLRYAHTIRHVADIRVDMDQAEFAEPLYDEAVAIYRGCDETSKLELANALRGTAMAKVRLGKDEGRALLEEVRALYAQLGVQAGVAESERALAKLAAAPGS
jgi:tetratricopeptide (TPR) repeat protein